MAGTVVNIDKNTVTSQDNGVVVLTANTDFITVDVSADDVFTFVMSLAAAGTITWTASVDGTNFFQITPMSSIGAALASSTSAAGQFVISATPFNYIKLVASGVTGNMTLQWMKQRGNISIGAIIAQLFPGTSQTSLGKAEDAPHSSGDVGVEMLGVRNDTGATGTSLDGDYGTIALHPSGAPYTKPLVTANTTNAVTLHRLASAASTNATSVKGAIGQAYWAIVANSNAAARFLKFYNKATAPTVGTDTPIATILLPPTSMTIIEFNGQTIPFALGIGYATTVGVADTDVAAVALNDVMMTLAFA